jgi:hypothetical protein
MNSNIQLRPKLLSLLRSGVKGLSANFITSSVISYIHPSARMRSLHYRSRPKNNRRRSIMCIASPFNLSVTMSRGGTAGTTPLCALLNSAILSTSLLKASLLTTSSSLRAISAGVKCKRTLLRHRLFCTISYIRTTSMLSLPT